MSSNYLKIFFLENNGTFIKNEFEYRNKPFSNSEVFCASVDNFKKLTQGDDVKTIYQLNFSLKEIKHDNFLPGDTIGILPQNDDTEVNELFKRLNLEGKCDHEYKLEILKDTTKKNAVIPRHIPPNCTLRNVFLKNIDIRTAPKKIFLKNLLNYTSDPSEKEKLETICFPKESREYEKLLNEHRTILSLLNAFPSCLPPVEVILEHSSPLQPRYFSIASSPLEKGILSIIFFVVEHENGLKGVCTGWLEKCIQGSLCATKKVPFYFRKPDDFRLNIQNRKPSVLVATGTGIAPFLGFLRHKKMVTKAASELGRTWLFYGCRYSNRDFLCADELKTCYEEGILTELVTAFSRETEQKVYVQHKILECGKNIVDLLLNKEATLYLCGDLKTVLKDVKEAIIQCFVEHQKVDLSSAVDIVNNLVKNKKYLVDYWI